MTYLLLALGVLLLGEKVWKHLMVLRFFRLPPPVEQRQPGLVSILQPILSGDPTLPGCLEHNLRLQYRYPIEFLWLVDDTDDAGHEICRKLIAAYPGRNIRLLLMPPPADGCNPKMVKLQAAIPAAQGEVLCVLDDDTMLPEGGLEACLPYLEQPGVGLAFGLPYYVCFANVWSSLVACFVNSHSLLTYVPYISLVEPFTINGMFYAMRRSVYEATGGFQGLEKLIADDFAVAQHFRSHGYRLAQTPVRHAISTQVVSGRAYLRLLQRWFIFPRETVMKALPWRELLVAYGLGMADIMAPLWLVAGLLAWPSWWTVSYTILYILYHYVIFAHFNIAYLCRATPWRRSWLVVLIQLWLPFQLLAAIIGPQRIVWRGHVMRIEAGGGFRFLKRRGA